MNINIRLAEPILPEGAVITADISRTDDLTMLSESILKVFEEANKSRVPVSALRLLEERVAVMMKAITDGLPAHVKLEIANKAQQ